MKPVSEVAAAFNRPVPEGTGWIFGCRILPEWAFP